MARSKKKTSTKRTKKKGGFFGRSAKKGTKNIFGGKPKGPASKKRKSKGKRKPMVSSKSPFTSGY